MATQNLPKLRDLTEDQLRGRACVWCSTPLNNATAIDLGAQRFQRLGHQAHWFPRACPKHGDEDAP